MKWKGAFGMYLLLVPGHVFCHAMHLIRRLFRCFFNALQDVENSILPRIVPLVKGSTRGCHGGCHGVPRAQGRRCGVAARNSNLHRSCSSASDALCRQRGGAALSRKHEKRPAPWGEQAVALSVGATRFIRSSSGRRWCIPSRCSSRCRRGGPSHTRHPSSS